ncbi:unnamed protein product [Adineta steineri]|uniref:ADP ribosyltransferase domain-containing protein n=1 Tax=Adineta steineri TaxID=433720 RepID=A0A818PF89_9BILA|nr:unnamed protein product [Adineta steineri]
MPTTTTATPSLSNETISMIAKQHLESATERIDENKENITLIWFDPDIESHIDTETTIERLREINDYVLFYTELNQCRTRIQSIHNEKIFLIISDTQASKLLPSIMNLPQIDSIFIFCTDKTEDKNFTNEYVKIVGVYEDLDSLYLSLEEQVKFVEKQLETFHIFDQFQKSIGNLPKQSAEFFWFQILKNTIDRFPQNLNSKTQALDICRSYYRGNSKQLKEIDDFENNYQSNSAIQWYANKSFVYKLISKALRSEDINQLYNFRFFLRDLTKNLAREHHKLIESPEKTLTVYRGMRLSYEELNKFKENQGKIISTDGYLCTTRRRDKALAFATKPTEYSNILPIVFEIQCDIQQLGNQIIFADIAEFSEHSSEREVLFDLDSGFRLESVEQDDDQVWIIKMNVSTDAQTSTHDYIEDTGRETDKKTKGIIFGQLMCQADHYDKSQRYFEQLLVYPNDEDIAWLEFNLGYVAQYKGDLTRARDLYDQAYDRMMHANPPRIQDSAYALSSIGTVLETQGKYDESRQFYERALKIRETFYPADHPDIALSLRNIGSLLYKRQKYPEALVFLQQALKIQEKYYPAIHPEIAYSLNLVGKVLLKQGKNSDSLKLSQQALKIQDKYYPDDHRDKIECLNNIAASYVKLKVPRMALVNYKRALAIQEKNLPIGHPDRASKCGYVVLILLIYWISEAIPVPVTSLLPLILFPLTGILKASDVASNYFKDTASLFFGSVTLAYAIQRVNLHRRAALFILTVVGSSTKWIMAGLMITTCLISMWINNAASTSIMLPVALAIADEYEQHTNSLGNASEHSIVTINGLTPANVKDESTEQEQKVSSNDIIKLRKGLILCVAYSSVYGGLSTIVGSAATVFLKGYVDEQYANTNFRLTFLNYLLLTLPTVVLMMISCWLWLQIRFNYHGWKEGVVAILFLSAIVLWITRDLAGNGSGWGSLMPRNAVSNGTVALLMAVLTMILPNEKPHLNDWKYNPIIPWIDLSKNYPWGTLLMLGAGLSIAQAFQVY